MKVLMAAGRGDSPAAGNRGLEQRTRLGAIEEDDEADDSDDPTKS